MKLRFVYGICIAWFVWVLLYGDMMTRKPGVGAVCLAIGVMGWLPVIRWLQNGVRTLPVYETYCLGHLIYYVQPAVQQVSILDQYNESVQVKGLLTVLLFLFALQVAFHVACGRIARLGGNSLSNGWLASYRLTDFRSSIKCWVLLWVWVVFETANRTDVLPNLGSLFQPAQTVVLGGGLFAVFNLTYAYSKKEMTQYQRLYFVLALAVQAVMDVSSGFLVGFARTAVVVGLSNTIATRRLPIVGMATLFFVMAFLHAGKGEMRSKFWGPGASNEAKNPIAVGQFWISASLEKITSGEITSTKAMTNMLGRGSLTHMVSLAVEECPRSRDYLYGETYVHLPLLLIPRAIWPEKPRGTWSSETLAVYMGIQTVEATDYTSIGMGQVAEGWINFGWVGVVLSGLWFGTLLSIPARLSLDGSANHARTLIAASCLPLATDFEHCLSQWTVIMMNSLLCATVAVYVLCRRERRRSGMIVVNPSGAGLR